MEAARSLVQGMWKINLDECTERQCDAYLRFCQAQGLHPLEEMLFIIELLKGNASIPKGVLKDGVAEMQKQLQAERQRCNRSIEIVSISGINIPPMREGVDENVFCPTFDVDRALTKGVLVMLATDLALNSSSISGHSITVWEDSKSLRSIMESSLPRLRPSTPSAVEVAIPAHASQIQPTKLRAKYLCDYTKVDIVWTKHLPDHLELEGKRLRVFELASYLELSKTAVDDSQTDFSACLEKGCFTSHFLTETLMTYPLLFPPKDRQWLKSQIKSHRKWSGWGWPTLTTELDARLAAPFDNTLAAVNYYQPLTNSEELYKRYPHWASRLQALYEEAEEPTPSSAIGRWAERRRAARHTYWVTVGAFALAILFGIMSTIVGVLQLWVSYCQWQVPNGGFGCRAPSS